MNLVRAQYSGCEVTTCARHKHEDMFVSIQTQIFARTLTLPGIKIGLTPSLNVSQQLPSALLKQ